MAELTLGTPGSGELSAILLAEDIEPGSDVGYQTAKRIFEHHPLGGKLAEKPVAMALSMPRTITIDGAPGDDVIEEFRRARRDLGLDDQVYRAGVISKIYGISALFIGCKGVDPITPLTIENLRDPSLYVNAVDPLNTAGSLVLNQDPLSPDYLKPREIRVAGKIFHRSRSVVLLNEMPVYLGWVDSAFGFSGRSVYQRILYSLKSYIECMKASDMLAKKAGVIVAETQQQSSATNQLAAMFLGRKRTEVKLAETGNVLSTGMGEKLYSLDMTNLAQSLETAMSKIRETIAAGSGTPAILINEETFAQGLSEGSEDSKYVAEFVEHERRRLDPLFEFTDRIAMARAWTPEFFAVIQNRYPDYRNKTYDSTVAEWKRQFKASWPSFLKESESQIQERAQKQLESLLSVVVQLLPLLDPENQSVLIDWFQDCINGLPELVTSQLTLDPLSLQEHLAEKAQQSAQTGLDPNVSSFMDSIVRLQRRA